MRMLNLSRILQSALVVVSLVGALAQAQAPAQAPASAPVPVPPVGGQKAFWCKSPNGVAALQLESCAPGTELRSEPVGPHGRVASPPPVQPAVAPAPAAPKAPVARRAPAAEEAAAAPVKEPRSNVTRIVLVSILMLLGVGLVLGLIRKFRTRSF